jgi:hypothetical protein
VISSGCLDGSQVGQWIVYYSVFAALREAPALIRGNIFRSIFALDREVSAWSQTLNLITRSPASSGSITTSIRSSSNTTAT